MLEIARVVDLKMIRFGIVGWVGVNLDTGALRVAVGGEKFGVGVVFAVVVGQEFIQCDRREALFVIFGHGGI